MIKLMAEEKTETKKKPPNQKGKIIAGILTVLTVSGIGGYNYYKSEEPPPPPKPKVVKEVELPQGIGFIDLTRIRDNLDNGEHLAELKKLETRLKLELKDAMKPVLMSPPKVEEKPFDDSVWQKNAQAIISEAAEIEKRKKQAAEEYRKATEEEHIKKRDEINNQFLNEVLNIKLKLQNADSMRLSSKQIEEFEKRLEEIQIERNAIQRQLMDQWVQEIAAHAEEAVKADAEKLRAQAQQSMAKITEEAKNAQTAAIERNKALMEKAMQESKARQDRRQQLRLELQEVTKERSELEDKMLDSIGDLAAKLAVIHKLKMILAVRDVDLINEELFPTTQSTAFEVNLTSTIEPMVIPSTDTVDLTDELIKELQINAKFGMRN